ncbi:MAG: FN3 associated domain-containing protein [Bacilli bacterium]
MKKRIITILIVLCLLISIYFLFVKINKDYKVTFNQYKIDDVNYNILKVEKDNNIKKYNYKIYKNNILLNEIKSTKNSINIKNDKILLNDEIKVVITLSNILSSKKITYNIKWQENITKVAPVMSNYKTGDIKGRKYLKLQSTTKDAKIYYTLDGSIPNQNSLLYENPIKLNKDIIVNTVAIKDNLLNSDFKIYKFNVINTTPIIYLSPSLQDENSGVANTGYSTEEAMMNKVADVVEPILKEAGFVVYRNNIKMDLTKCVNDSKKRGVDLHIAFHSNASSGSYSGKYTGIETWKYDNNNEIVNEISKLLQKNIMKTYYNQNKNRGVKNSIDIGGLRETNPLKVDNGILMELGFHDNYSDAIWISNNIKNIGTNIAKTLIKYYNDFKF